MIKLIYNKYGKEKRKMELTKIHKLKERLLDKEDEKVKDFSYLLNLSNQLSREKLGFSKGKNTALFKALLSKGLIISEGTGRGTKYKLKV